MTTQGALTNPFGKSHITITYQHDPTQIGRIVELESQQRLGLQIGDEITPLNWTNDEIYARFGAKNFMMLYVFSPQGAGFALDQNGQQHQFLWD